MTPNLFRYSRHSVRENVSAKASQIESTARSIAPLLVSWWIVIDEYTLDPKIRGLLVACIAQEQRLAAVTDEYKRVVGDFQHAHVKFLQLSLQTPTSSGADRATLPNA